ncbi:DUF6319 family protein [Gordonia spumicola]|nr:DUF6319 family protein [Gordonia spumicola]
MPPRRRSDHASESLTSDDLVKLTTALADGKRATVYLREGMASLGLAAGASARVVSIDGSTVTIRPTGVDDELPFEADELRITKKAPAVPEPATAKPRKAKTTPAPTTNRPPLPPRETPVTSTTPAAKPAAKPAARRAPTKKATSSVTVTIYGTADNEWSIAMVRGGKKPQRSRPVTPEAVDSAMRELGDDTARDAVTSLLHAAREEAQRRVEQLSRELDAARQALAALESPEARA